MRVEPRWLKVMSFMPGVRPRAVALGVAVARRSPYLSASRRASASFHSSMGWKPGVSR